MGSWALGGESFLKLLSSLGSSGLSRWVGPGKWANPRYSQVFTLPEWNAKLIILLRQYYHLTFLQGDFSRIPCLYVHWPT